MTWTRIAAASAALLLAAPAVAAAKGGHHDGHDASPGKRPKTVSLVLKGTYEGDGAVRVAKANGPARKAGLAGRTVTLDLAAARIVVADVNGDGVRDAADVLAGDQVVVKVRAPRGATAADILTARELVDRAHTRHGGDDDEPEAPERPEAD